MNDGKAELKKNLNPPSRLAARTALNQVSSSPPPREFFGEKLPQCHKQNAPLSSPLLLPGLPPTRPPNAGGRTAPSTDPMPCRPAPRQPPPPPNLHPTRPAPPPLPAAVSVAAPVPEAPHRTRRGGRKAAERRPWGRRGTGGTGRRSSQGRLCLGGIALRHLASLVGYKRRRGGQWVRDPLDVGGGNGGALGRLQGP